MLRNVALSEPLREFDSRVLSLTTFEPIGRQIASGGVPTTHLGVRGSMLRLEHWRMLRDVMDQWQPDIVHSWMYHANVAVALVLRSLPASRRPRHIAAVRGAVGGPKAQSNLTRVARRVDALFSTSFDGLVFNSSSVRDQHAALGYSIRHAVVIPNGFDTSKFRPSEKWRAEERATLGLSNEPLIGMVARYHPVKGQHVFVEAAALLIARRPECRFALVGAGCDVNNLELSAMLRKHGLTSRVSLLGERADVAPVLNAFDVGVCASISESFPNAIGEAMASGVPCIVPAVGDCAYLVGETGWVVPVGDSVALATAMEQAVESLALNVRERAEAARRRIEESFSLEQVTRQYADLYRATHGRPAPTA